MATKSTREEIACAEAEIAELRRRFGGTLTDNEDAWLALARDHDLEPVPVPEKGKFIAGLFGNVLAYNSTLTREGRILGIAHEIVEYRMRQDRPGLFDAVDSVGFDGGDAKDFRHRVAERVHVMIREALGWDEHKCSMTWYDWLHIFNPRDMAAKYGLPCEELKPVNPLEDACL